MILLKKYMRSYIVSKNTGNKQSETNVDTKNLNKKPLVRKCRAASPDFVECRIKVWGLADF